MSRGLEKWDERAERALPPLLVLAAFLKELGKEVPIARALIGVAERGADEAFQAEVTTFLRTLVDLGQEQARQNSSLAEDIAGLAGMVREASDDWDDLLAFAEDSPQWSVGSGDLLRAGLRAAAVISYQANLVLEYQWADYRGITDRSDEKEAFLPLAEVFVPPALVAEGMVGNSDLHERELLAELDLVESPDVLETLERRWYEAADRALQEEAEASGTVSCWEAIREAQHVVVLGRAGSGKSTLTRFLAYALSLGAAAKSHLLGWAGDEVPVRVELSAFAQHRRESVSTASLRSFIDEQFDERGGRLLREGMGELFEKGDVLVLLDGLDEEPDPARRLGLAKAIERFVIDHDTCRVIVTSRPKPGYVYLKGDLAHFGIASLTDPQVDDLVHRWRLARERRLLTTSADEARAARDANEDLAEIRASPDILKLGRTPLVLTLLLSLRTSNLRLPRQRVEVIDRLVRKLLGAWQQARAEVRVEDDAEIDEDDLLAAVAQVAFDLRKDQPGFAFPQPVLERYLAQALADQEIDTIKPERTARSYVQALTNRAGLIDERTPGWMAFWHLSFQEYLAAVHLATGTETTPAVLDLRDDPSWRDVVIATASYIGHVQKDKVKAGHLVLAIADEDPPPEEPLLHPMLQLAAAVAAADVNLRPSVMSQVVARLSSAVNRFPTRALEETFVDTARSVDAFVPDGSAVRALIGLTTSANQAVRIAAVRVLANAAPTDEQARTACKQARQDSDSDVRAHAALGLVLADHATDGDILALLRAIDPSRAHLDLRPRLAAAGRGAALVDFLTHPNPNVRSQAVRTLGRFDDIPDEGLTALVALLLDEDARVRCHAAVTLRNIGTHTDEADTILVDLLKDGDVDVVLQASAALRKIGKHAGDAITALVGLLTDDSRQLRATAAAMLGKFDELPEDAVAALVALLNDDAAQVRSQSAATLHAIGHLPGEAVTPLVDLLTDDNPQVRNQTVATLRRIGNHTDSTTTALVELLADDNPHARYHAAVTLRKIGGHTDDAITALVQLLTNDNSEARSQAAATLGSIRYFPDEAVTALVDFLTDDDNPEARDRAMQAMRRFRHLPGEAGSALVALLTADDPYLRYHAAMTLRSIRRHNGEADHTLLDLLTDDDPQVRFQTAVTLRRIRKHTDEATTALVALLAAEDPELRFRAANTLGRTADPPDEAVSVLVALLADEDAQVRSRTTVMLRGIDDLPDEALSALVALLCDDNPTTRYEAAMTLGEQSLDAFVMDDALHQIENFAVHSASTPDPKASPDFC